MRSLDEGSDGGHRVAAVAEEGERRLGWSTQDLGACGYDIMSDVK